MGQLTKDTLRLRAKERYKKVDVEGDDFFILQLNGLERDEYMAEAIDTRDSLRKQGEDPASIQSAAAGISKETAAKFTHLEYVLVQMCILDPDALASLQKLFDTPAQVSEMLTHQKIKALARACTEINGLGDEQEKNIRSDFPPTSKNEPGSGSPAAPVPST